MARLRVEQIQAQQMRQEMRPVLRMEQASLLEMPQDEFSRLVVDIEHSPVFQRLYHQEKLIRYQKFPRSDISPSFYQLKDEIAANEGSLDVETLLLNKAHIVQQIQKLGLEKFKRYFLFPESFITAEEIAAECDLAVSEVQRINSLIDSFSIMSEFYHPSKATSQSIYYSRVAAINRDRDGFIISYFSPSSARGKYSIDYTGFEELVVSGALSKAEVKESRQLFRKLEIINSCRDVLNRVLVNIIEKQTPYLESGDFKSLLPFSQKELAHKIGLAPSSVSRAIRNRSIDTPWGQEVPMKEFFPRPRLFRRELIRQLLETESDITSDEAVRARLWDKFGVAISRRSVADLRQELKVPATGKGWQYKGANR